VWLSGQSHDGSLHEGNRVRGMEDLSRLVARRNVARLNQRARELVTDDLHEEALRVAEEGSGLARASLSFDCAELVAILNTLAAINMHLRRYGLAEAVLREIVTDAAQSSLAETEEYAIALNNLALACARQYRDAEAIPLMEQAIALKRRIFGALHPSLLGNLQDIALLLAESGRDADAVPYFEEMRDIIRDCGDEADPEYAGVVQNLALAQRNSGRLQEAEETARKAAEILDARAPAPEDSSALRAVTGPEAPDSEPNDVQMVAQVLAVYAQGDYEKAQDLQRKVLATLPRLPLPEFVQQAIGNPSDPFLSHIGKLDEEGYAAEQRGDLSGALLKYEQVARMTEASLGMNHPKNAGPFNNLAQITRKQGKFADAKRLYCRALATVGATDESDEPKRTILGNIAGLFQDIAEEVAPNPGEEAFDFKRATTGKPKDYTISARIRFPLPIEGELPVSNTMRWLDARAKFYESLGSFEKTRFLYELIVELCALARGERHRDLIAPLQELASFEIERGYFAEARKHIDAAIVIAEIKAEGNEALVVGLLWERSKLLSNIGQNVLAETTLIRAIDIGRGRLHEAALDDLEENLAVVRLRMGQVGSAAPTLHKILERVPAEPDKVDPRRLQQLANFASALEDHERALKYYEASIEGQRRQTGEWTAAFALTLSNYATQLRTMGRWAEAEVNYRRALEIRRVQLGPDHPNLVETLIRLALVLQARDRADEALAAVEEALAVGIRVAGQLSAMSSDAARLDIVRRQLSHLGIALSIVHASLTSDFAAVARAYELVLRRKAIAAQALVAQRTAVLSGRYPHLEPKLRALDELRSQIVRNAMQAPPPGDVDKHSRLLAEAIQHRQAVETELAGEIAEMRLETPLAQVSVAAVADALPPESTLIEFVKVTPYHFKGIEAKGDPSFLASRYLAFVLPAARPDALKLIDLGESAEIDDLVRRVAARVAPVSRHIGPAASDEAAVSVTPPDAELSRRTLERAIAYAGDAKRLLIAPDGNLFLVAFDALPLQDHRFVIDEYEISFLGTGRDAIRFSSPPSASLTSPVIVAAPDFDLSATDGAGPSKSVDEDTDERGWLNGLAGRLNPLPGALAEGKELRSRLPNARLLSGKEALESTVRQVKRPRILHFATHGFAVPSDQNAEDTNGDAMMRSGIALAGANAWLQKLPLPPEAEDGIMTAEDLATLDLIDTEMTVISACETGIGDILSGEGVFGLRRAFSVAGVRSIVMSLWKVPDHDTRELMTQFYDHLLKDKSKPAALRAAKLALRRAGRSRQSWGAFICEGDWNSLRGAPEFMGSGLST
jgi:tetratricopeptide (TPR) repeat protein